MTTGTPPVTGPAKTNFVSTESFKQSGSNSQAQQDAAVSQRSDAAVFVISERETVTQERQAYQALQSFLEQMKESNRQIKEAAQRWKPFYPEPCAVPSALGLSVDAASKKLKAADLKVRRVVREYNERVPEGHVISQIPGPGGSASKKSGVALVISKGPPPEKEKYDTMRKRENVPILRVKSKDYMENKVRAQCALERQVVEMPAVQECAAVAGDSDVVIA